jgi:sirohydrochlorin cobaltochelatase
MSQDQADFEALEARLRTILPEEYQDCYEDIEPVSMGSASLKYTSDGNVAWNEIWSTFCDLAMAGGPPHKGKLLEPGSPAEIDAQHDRYQRVLEEICRGIRMVADLPVQPSPIPGWVRVDCKSAGMAGWLVRAIVMENVSAHCEGSMLDLPVGPGYRVEKEIKNVITVIAKTCHYWLGHMWPAEHREINGLFAKMALESPLLQPAISGDEFRTDADQAQCETMSKAIYAATGLSSSNHQYVGWLGVNCPSVRAAIWMMRAMVVSNVLSRREETVLFVPVNSVIDPNGEIAASSLARIHGFAATRNIF